MSISSPLQPDLHGAVQVYVYDETEYDKTLELIDTTTPYALTGSMYDEWSMRFLRRLPVLIDLQLLAGSHSTCTRNKQAAQRVRQRVL